MLSRMPLSQPWRRIEVSVEEEAGVSSTSRTMGNVMVLETSSFGRYSTRDASSQIADRVRESGRWVEIDRMTYFATDESGWSSHYGKRALSVRAKVHP